MNHYQGGFYDDGTGHNDFSLGTSAARKSIYVMLAPNSSVEVYLEWDDQFGHSGNDYNLYFSNADRSPRVYGDLQFSENVQNGTGDPLESIRFKNTGATTIGRYHH